MNINQLLFFYFLLLGASVLIRNINFKKYHDFFWFCDLAPFLFALGFFLDNMQFVKAVVSVGLIGQIFAFFNVIPMRIVEWNKNKINHKQFYILTDILIHLTTIIVFLLTINIAPNEDSLKYSLLILLFMFTSSLLFTPKKENVNTIYFFEINTSHGSKRFRLPFHTYLWIVYAFLQTLLSFFLQYLAYNHL